jgi:hypothetical protein
MTKMLIVDAGRESSRKPIWGTGGWLKPEDREALDWAALARLSGWDVHVLDALPELDGDLVGMPPTWIVLGLDPETITRGTTDLLQRWLESVPVTVVSRAGPAGSPIAALATTSRAGPRSPGRELAWVRTGERERLPVPMLEGWHLRMDADAAPHVELDGAALVAVRTVGAGTVVTLGFHPSSARDQGGAVTDALRRVLAELASHPVAWLDLSGAMVLRMDDPGAAQSVHLRPWAHRELDAEQWQGIGALLQDRGAVLSVGYVPGWVDDGDSSRGTLEVAGIPVDRVPGRVHPSAHVVYAQREGSTPAIVHDFASEHRALTTLRARGSIDLELHGFTHQHPDRLEWAAAPDRYDSIAWYREFGPAALPALLRLAPDAHPLDQGRRSLQRDFGITPSTIIFPGDDWTNEALERALVLDFQIASSYYTAIRHADGFLWAQHLCAPYLDQADANWFAAGFPVVGYFHDRDIALEGLGWLAENLDAWRAAGASRFLTFRGLAAMLTVRFHVVGSRARPRLMIDAPDAAAWRPPGLELRVRVWSLDSVAIDDIEVVASDQHVPHRINSVDGHSVLLTVTFPTTPARMSPT